MNTIEKQPRQEVEFAYEIGSNVISVNGDIKFLNIIIWNETTYEEIKKHIL